MKKKVVIIGNGFDLYNGLPTSYYDFYDFVVGNDLLSESVKEIYSFVDCKQSWNYFEENLIGVNTDYVYEVLSVGKFAPGYTGKIRELSIEKTREDLENSKAELISLFSLWIKSIKERNLFNFDNAIYLEDDAVFINFNYTKTLEYVYHVLQNDVLHIHGDVNNVVVGCGKESLNFLLRDARTIKGHPAYIAMRSFARKSIKPVKSMITKRLVPFLDKFQFDDNVEIYVLGHSKNEIDKEYFSFINEKYKNSIWKFSIFSSNDDAKTDAFAKEIGIEKYFKSSMESLLNELVK